MDDKLKQTNEKRIQILKPFVDHRGNAYFAGVMEPGTITNLSLKKATYNVLEEDEQPENVEKRFNLGSTTKSFIKEMNPTLTKENPPEVTIVKKDLVEELNTVKRVSATNKKVKSEEEV